MAEPAGDSASSKEGAAEGKGSGFSFGGFFGGKKEPTEATPLVKEDDGKTESLLSDPDKKEDEKDEFGENSAGKQIWLTVVIVVASNSFLTNARQAMIGAFLPGEVEDRGLTSSTMGTLIMSQMIAVVVTSFAASGMCTRFGTLNCYIFSLVLASIIPWINAYGGDPLYGTAFSGLMICTRIIDGIAQGFTEVAGLSMLLRVSPTPEVVTMSIGISESIRGIGTLLGPLFGGWLYEACGFKGPYVFSGIAAIFAVVAMFLFVKPSTLGEEKVKTFGNIWTLMKIPMIWAPTIVNGFTIIPMGSLEATFEPFLLAEPFNMEQGAIGTVMSVGAIGMAIAAVLTGFFQKYVGQLTQICTGQALMCLGGVAISFSNSIGLTVFSYICLTLGTGFALVVSAALMSRLVRTFDHDPVEYSELISGLLVANFALGYGLGSQAGGAIAAAVGFRDNALGMGIMCGIIPFFLVILLQKPCLGRDLAPPVEEGGDVWTNDMAKKPDAGAPGTEDPNDPGADIVGGFASKSV